MKKESIKLSVIIPVYNMEKYLRYSLDSVLNQDLADMEIIRKYVSLTHSSASELVDSMFNAILWQKAPYFVAVSEIAASSRLKYKLMICKSSISIPERSRKLFKPEFPLFFHVLLFAFLHTPENIFVKFSKKVLTYKSKCAARLVTIYASHQTRPL